METGKVSLKAAICTARAQREDHLWSKHRESMGIAHRNLKKVREGPGKGSVGVNMLAA